MGSNRYIFFLTKALTAKGCTCTLARMELQEFMEANNISDPDLATEVNLSRSTISRVRRKMSRPEVLTLLKIDAWAADLAQAKRIRRSERLDWGYLLADPM